MARNSRKRLHNDLDKKIQRRDLRSRLTPAEASLWKALKNKQLDGRKFRRQYGVGPYILDFFCPEEELNIELDGESHSNQSTFEKDQVRDTYLKELGITVLRFENKDVFDSRQWVLGRIRSAFKANSDPGTCR